MALGATVKKLQDIMRRDAGLNGDAQRIEQLAWMLFLKVYDAREASWEIADENYVSIIPERFRWSSWAEDNRDGEAFTGDALLNFVNNELFPALKTLPIDADSTFREALVRDAYEDNNNYMKDGYLLRQTINVINEIDFIDARERRDFSQIYETILKSLQSAGNAGEFYTPRAVTDFMAEVANPKVGERVADFACGTGGFLISALKIMSDQLETTGDLDIASEALYGVEKKALPYLLCAANMFLHEADNPKLFHANALEFDVRDYGEDDKFDVILMNPPYGGSERDSVKKNFPVDLRSSETADLFMALIMYRLKQSGRAGVIIPDGFLFGVDNAKLAIKEKLLTEFNLHTVIRLPAGAFAPYTSITTNILFFDNTGPTKETWFYRLDAPEEIKVFSKTRPMTAEHLNPAREWLKDKRELVENGFDKAKRYAFGELKARGFNLDLCGYPQEKEEILSPDELYREIEAKRRELEEDLANILSFLEPLRDKAN